MKVLIVDDDNDIRKFLRTCLELDGYAVQEASTGDAGLQEVVSFEPDLIVLDQMMPGLLGTEVAAKLRKGGYGKPILLFSAYLNPEVNEAVLDLGLIPISKVDTDAVFRVIKGYAEGAS